MAIVCSMCDREPPASATAGAACPHCGERLLAFTGDDLTGTVIDGRFEVLGPLGHGGMGVVYRGKQLSIGREVAIKMVDRRIEKDVSAVKRFFREAKLASTLAHPNTVPIIDFGQSSDGRLYLVMELVNGRTLAEEISAVGPLPPARVIGIGVQLCEALERAHELAIVHRDLKLENVMLVHGKRDHVKILDFGLARSLADPTSAMTATGLISGTPRYMPPEVALDGAAPSASQDMYALGVILAELAVGRALWIAPTLEALMTKKLDTEQSITEVPDPLRRIVRSLLAIEAVARPSAVATRQLLRDADARSPLHLELEAPTVPVVPTPESTGEASFAAKLARAVSPVALEPTAELEPHQLLPVTDVHAADPFANAAFELVAIDEREGAPPKPAAPASPVSPVSIDGPATSTGDRFAAPDDAGAPAKLEVDRKYTAEKVERQRTPVPDPVLVVKPPSRAWIWILLLLVLAGGGGAYWYFYVRKPAVAVKDPPRPEGGVSISITADTPVPITIDGKRAGTTPLQLKTPKSTTSIRIEGVGVQPREVIPDRDQTVKLEPTQQD